MSNPDADPYLNLLGRAQFGLPIPRINPCLPRPAMVDAKSGRLHAWYDSLIAGEGRDHLLAEAMSYWRSALADQFVSNWITSQGVPFYDLCWRYVVGAAGANGQRFITFGVVSGCPASCVDVIVIDPGDLKYFGSANRLAGVLATDNTRFEIDGWPEGKRIRLFRHPLDWLRTGAPEYGYCVLDWQCWHAGNLLHMVDQGQITVVCDDDEHAGALRARARLRKPKMKIEVAAR